MKTIAIHNRTAYNIVNPAARWRWMSRVGASARGLVAKRLSLLFYGIITASVQRKTVNSRRLLLRRVLHIELSWIIGYHRGKEITMIPYYQDIAVKRIRDAEQQMRLF
jgi:hypothetical protein